nr:energy transducer TonB [Roseibium limicola]
MAKPEPPKKKITKKKPAKPRGTNVSSRKGADNANPKQQQSSRQGTNAGNAKQQGNAARSNYSGKVHSKIARAKRYVRNRRVKGRVRISFVVSRNGAVSNIRISGSSGNSETDQAAVLMVRKAGRMPKMPPEMPGNSMSFSIPISFQ